MYISIQHTHTTHVMEYYENTDYDDFWCKRGSYKAASGDLRKEWVENSHSQSIPESIKRYKLKRLEYKAAIEEELKVIKKLGRWVIDVVEEQFRWFPAQVERRLYKLKK